MRSPAGPVERMRWFSFRWCLGGGGGAAKKRGRGKVFPGPTSVSVLVMRSGERGDEDRLDRVEPVLRLVEDDGVRRLEDLVGDLERA
ncbi:hypothetical protein GCM10010449_35290 [Streptomyces rectiviolaceus]|uniref:Uncharacterized protein n=1 Tax=Streptomyces rectiviolaceus TaxID=332591 RepID=A0ABP6MHX4_9ACTN